MATVCQNVRQPLNFQTEDLLFFRAIFLFDFTPQQPQFLFKVFQLRCDVISPDRFPHRLEGIPPKHLGQELQTRRKHYPEERPDPGH
jgi:hypothetical protein